jgi:hypothetical protein
MKTLRMNTTQDRRLHDASEERAVVCTPALLAEIEDVQRYPVSVSPQTASLFCQPWLSMLSILQE